MVSLSAGGIFSAASSSSICRRYDAGASCSGILLAPAFASVLQVTPLLAPSPTTPAVLPPEPSPAAGVADAPPAQASTPQDKAADESITKAASHTTIGVTPPAPEMGKNDTALKPHNGALASSLTEARLTRALYNLRGRARAAAEEQGVNILFVAFGLLHWIDPETKEPRYKVIGKADWHTHIAKVDAKGLCGSAIIQVVAEMFKAGIVDKSGRFVMDLGTPRVRKDAEGKPEYVLAWASETSIGQDITITQGDVRALQLAKGALYTGAKLMMKKLGIATLDRVILAGAFGSHIDREASMTLGMFPDCPIDKVYAVGNAAGDGSRMALMNRGKRIEANERARWVEFVEIATDPAFEKEFMMAMHIPHMKDKFPNLKELLEKSKSLVEIKA